MAKRQTATIGDYSFHARTLTEARAQAAEFAEKACSGDWAPVVIEWQGHRRVIYRTPGGWDVMSWGPDNREEGVQRGGCVSSTNSSKAELIESCCLHIAQNCWSREIGRNYTCELLENFPARARELESWVRFQMRFAWFENAGKTREECHNLASDSRHATPYDERTDAPEGALVALVEKLKEHAGELLAAQVQIVSRTSEGGALFAEIIARRAGSLRPELETGRYTWNTTQARWHRVYPANVENPNDRYSERCTSGCRNDPRALCGLCEAETRRAAA